MTRRHACGYVTRMGRYTLANLNCPPVDFYEPVLLVQQVGAVGCYAFCGVRQRKSTAAATLNTNPLNPAAPLLPAVRLTAATLPTAVRSVG